MDPSSIDTEEIVSKVNDADGSSRRSFLQKSAAAGAGALALAVGTSNTALAHVGTDDAFSDVDVLNFALRLEHLEYAFYRDGLERFGKRDFTGVGQRMNQNVRGKLKDVRNHEDTHVSALTAAVRNRGGTPAQEECYEFGYDNVNEFIGVAALLENTGVSAYTGAIDLIDEEALLTTGATIATVEARHASFLNLLNGDSPFPAAFDTPKDPGDILAAAGGFIVPCE